MLTILAFVVALGLLIAIHEYGHYRVAVACGVKVLRFSIGMGKPLLRWQGNRGETEFVVAALPLGGYVRMLDERQGEVAADERHRAFNQRPLRQRVAIVAAGPLANLLLAVVLYSVANWVGTAQPKAVLAAPVPMSLAAAAGFQGKEWVQAIERDGQQIPVQSFEDFRWQLTRAALDGDDVVVEAVNEAGGSAHRVHLPLSSLQVEEVDAALLQRIGWLSPWTPAQLGDLEPDAPAARAGLQPGDVVVAVNGQLVADGAQLRRLIRESRVEAGQAVVQAWTISRAGQQLVVDVTPALHYDGDVRYGRIGAMVGSMPEMVHVQSAPLEGLWQGVTKTWDVAVLSVKMLGRMLTGQASLQNLSGPLTIADYAGKSASLGVMPYVLFLAMLSVSLGVLNLLPLPVLDGGHLMYYLWEGVTGHPVSDAWMERLQRVGISLLLVMMSIAFYNDISRLWG